MLDNQTISWIFGITIFTGIWLAGRIIKKSDEPEKSALGVGVLLGWLLLTGMAGQRGVFNNSSLGPWYLAGASVLASIGLVFLIRKFFKSPATGALKKDLLVWQASRIGIGIILFLWVDKGWIPSGFGSFGAGLEVTYGAIALFSASREKIHRRLHFVGAGLLAYAAIVGAYYILSFMPDSGNFFLGVSPYLWLPLVYMPLALGTHYMGIMKSRD